MPIPPVVTPNDPNKPVSANAWNAVADAINTLQSSAASLGELATQLAGRVTTLESSAPPPPPDTTPPQIISASVVDVPENQVLSHTLISNEIGVTWTKIGGADAALFTLADNTLIMTGRDFEDAHGPAYVVEVAATDAAGNAASQTITVNVTNVSDTADVTKPTITSTDTHTAPENDTYAAVATADEAVTWSKGGVDAELVTLHPTTGAWSIPAQDHETKPTVSFTLTATDAAANLSDPQVVTVTISDVFEGDTTAPTITSNANHTSPENQTYSATATANEAVTWSKGGADATLVTLNAATGAWSVGPQNYETKPSVAFELIAIDGAGLATAQQITLAITDVAEGLQITSPNTHTVAPNTFYMATATANQPVTWLDDTGPDAANVGMNNGTGAWSLPGQPASKATVNFTLQARSVADTSIIVTQDVVVTISAGTGTGGLLITSTATHSVAENQGYSTTAVANRSSTWSKAGVDAGLVTLNTSTGAWSVAAQDYETKKSLSFTLTATETAVPANTASQSVTLTITNVVEAGETQTFAITSPSTFGANEFDSASFQGQANQTVTHWSVGGTDGALIGINNSNGQWSIPSTNRIDRQSYNFVLSAKNAANVTVSQNITVTIQDLPGLWGNGVSEFPHILILPTDPNYFQTATYQGIQNVEWDDEDPDHPVPWFANAYRYSVTWTDGAKATIFDMDIDHGSEANARVELNKIANALGQVPKLLRDHLYRVCGMKGTVWYDGASAEDIEHRIKIGSGRVATRISQGKLPMTMFHECMHACLQQVGVFNAAGDARGLGFDYKVSTEWAAAKAADNAFATNYSTASDGEDFAESGFLAWAMIYHPDRLPSNHRALIEATIPNRIEFFRKVFNGTQTVTKAFAITTPTTYTVAENTTLQITPTLSPAGSAEWRRFGPDIPLVGIFNDTGQWTMAAQNYETKTQVKFTIIASRDNGKQTARQDITVNITDVGGA